MVAYTKARMHRMPHYLNNYGGGEWEPFEENIWKWGKGRIERGDSLEKWLMRLYSN